MSETKVSVVTITCRVCGRVVEQSIPRYTDAEEVPTERPCSPAFATSAGCPEHPPGPPTHGLSYTAETCPLLWTVKLIELPS